ncbi:MAG: DUF72 domain-containing protein [Aquificota bacterium]|nr:DUF72 domain-containing protein [Aquificota bacterium]
MNYYERFFDVLELNFSFYKMPDRKAMEAFVEKSNSLRFSVKANSLFTHERSYNKEHVKIFIDSLIPLIEAERFIGILFQFPQSFHFSAESLEYLRGFRKISGAFRGSLN